MAYISIKCKNCGSTMSMNINSKTITCIHCGSTFLLSQILDEKDMAFIDTIKPNDLSKKINVSEALKDGESCLFQGDYEKSEEFFKKAIELDDKNYKGYLGVVRAKTHNYNMLPNSNDYQEYSKLALKYADGDDLIYVKNELEKIPLLKAEKEQIMKAKAEKFATKTVSKHNLITKITSIIVAFLLVGILIGIILNQNQGDDPNTPKNSIYEISSKNDYLTLKTKENFLSSTIIIKNDINFEGETIFSIGSQTKPFTGKFYGNGHTFSNFQLAYENVEDESFIGLFKYAKNAIITGINISSASFTKNSSNDYYSNNHIGFICAYAENTQIKKCSVDNTCTIIQQQSTSQSFTVGGIVGKAINSQISLCYSQANIGLEYSDVQLAYGFDSLTFYLGGIVGYAENTNIANSYSAGKLTSTINSNIIHKITSYTSGLVGYVTYNSDEYYISNSFFAGRISSTINNTVPSDEPDQHVSAIAYIQSAYDNMLLNFVYFESSNFEINDTAVQKLNLADFTTNVNHLVFCESQISFKTKISEQFNTKDWDFQTDYPTLK